MAVSGKKNEISGVEALVVIAILCFAPPIWSGYALSVLWSWFIVPKFNLPALDIPTAIGIALVVDYMTKQSYSGLAKSEDHSIRRTAIEALFRPAFALLFGWIVTKFM